MRIHPAYKTLLLAVAIGILAIGQAKADELYGKITGTITDPSGAVVAGCQVTATNVGTGVSTTVASGPSGNYEFLQLAAPGIYKVSARQSGFKVYEVQNIHLELNQPFALNIKLELGAVAQLVSVEAVVAQINTTSMQLGTTITGNEIQDMPLASRNWIQLQQIQPGVTSASDRLGAGLNGTTFATNGAETQQNSFYVNGVDTADIALNTAAVIPSPDAIGEFHMVTSTINPEYGRNSGAILNAVIKSGTNALHGDGFEFYRDTFLDARNFFQQTVSPFQQNQFGGTIGGPIWIPKVYNGKDRSFFFFSYEGTRNVIPQAFGVPTVYTGQERNGDFSDLPPYYNSNNPEPANSPCGTGYSGPFGPNPLAQTIGTKTPGTPYCVAFPTGVIPQASLNPLATKLMTQFVPSPNLGTNQYTFNPSIPGVLDQYIGRVDHTFSSHDSIWGYNFWQRNLTTQTLPFVGATLPGFEESDAARTQQYALAWNHVFSGNTLNEARFGYFRVNIQSVNAVDPINPTKYGFTGINPQFPSTASLPAMDLTGYFNLGFSEYGPQPRLDSTYQVIDNFSHIAGRHTLKFGFSMNRFEVYNPFGLFISGYFDYGGAGSFSTGNAGADFLIGQPDYFIQDNGAIIDARSREYYFYGQDEFKLRPNLTITFGAGWDIETPYLNLYYEGKEVNAFRQGQQSTVFPLAPTGVLWPGDAGINSTGGVHTPSHDIAPRLGFAWSPGGSKNWSIHAGVGIYYNRTEEELALQNLSTPPFSLLSFGVGDVGGSPSFATPYSGWCGPPVTTCSRPNPFPYAPQFGASVPIPTPIAISTLSPHFGSPMSGNYNVTVERQLGSTTTVTVAYVGNQGRHLEEDYETNPAGNRNGNPAAAAAGCSPFSGSFGSCAGSTFRYNPVTTGLATIAQQATDANSNYNSLQIQVNKRLTHGMGFMASYTWSRFFDDNSTPDNQDGFIPPGVNPFGGMYGPSDNDAPQRLVLSYEYTLPFYHFAPHARPLIDGWKFVGITTFQSGFPIRMADTSAPSDTCWGAEEVIDVLCWDRPAVTGTRFAKQNPRTYSITLPGQTTPTPNYYFNPATFTSAPAGTFAGEIGRNTFYGPGLNNFDLSLLKDIHITENKYIQLRFETYNTFNHTQFTPYSFQPNNGIGGVVADVNAGNFGTVVEAQSGRVIQIAGKIYF
jgi:hypothetical protein